MSKPLKPDIQARLAEIIRLQTELNQTERKCFELGKQVVAMEEAGQKRGAAPLRKEMKALTLRIMELERRLGPDAQRSLRRR